MKSIWTKIALSGFTLFSLISTFALQGCKDDEDTKWVDLRYRVEDSYTVPHHATADEDLSIDFEVKSTDPWEVFGETNGDWYTISPASGDDPAQTYTVVITCEENMSLDDRVEVFDIKSDYWTGKTFTLTQKGIAFMENNYDASEGVHLIPMDGASTVTFQLTTNQNWTAEVTEGADWLTIVSGTSGTGNATLDGEEFNIEISGDSNSGAMRYGVITIYDRNGDVGQTIRVTQDGVQLEPTQPENGVYWAVYGEAQQLTIHVASNSRWEISKGDETNDTWFDIEGGTEHENDADIVLNIQEHGDAASTRTANLILTSISDDPSIEPVVSTIQIRQASTDLARTTTHSSVSSSGGDNWFYSGVQPGLYNFYVEPFGDSSLELFFGWYGVATSSGTDCQFNYKIQNRTTNLSITPWSSAIYTENSGRSVDTDQPHVISVDYRTLTNDEGTWLDVEYLLDGVSYWGNTVSDGRDQWVVAYSALANVSGQLLLRVSSGSVTFSSWEYIAPIDWGE